MKYLKQLAVLLACCVGGDLLSRATGQRLPGAVLGLALLLVLLLCGAVKEQQIAGTSDFLLQNMAFFFLPACLGVLDVFAQIKSEIVAILAVCVLTTLCTAAATALTVRLVCSLQRRGKKEADDNA